MRAKRALPPSLDVEALQSPAQPISLVEFPTPCTYSHVNQPGRSQADSTHPSLSICTSPSWLFEEKRMTKKKGGTNIGQKEEEED